LAFTQSLKLDKELPVHKGCVNSISWSADGSKILSGSDDQKLVITDPFNSKVLIRYTTVHRSNIFSAKFLPQGISRVVSCSGGGGVLYTNFDEVGLTKECEESNTLVAGNYRASNQDVNFFSCHSGTCYEVMTVESEYNNFFSCGEDGSVRFYDLRLQSKCHKQYCRENILILSPESVSAMSCSPISHNYIAIGSSDSLIRIFDRRYLKLVEFPSTSNESASPPSLSSLSSTMQTKPVKMFKIPNDQKHRTYRITSVNYSRDESELLVSYSSEYLYLFDVNKDGISKELIPPKISRRRRCRDSPRILRKLRLRGDWSDTGPESLPSNEISAQSRPQLNSSIMNRMSNLLSRMLHDNNTSRQQRQQNRAGSESRIAEGLQMLFETDQEGENSTEGETSGVNNDNPSSPPHEESSSSSSSSSSSYSSCDEEASQAMKFDYVKQKFVGHRNARTMIKESNFWGDDFVSFALKFEIRFLKL
jgi:DDB1- and CUL4-associated factor 6